MSKVLTGAGLAVLAAMTVAGCRDRTAEGKPAETPAAVAAPRTSAAGDAASAPAAAGAPGFAVLYPGAQPLAPAVIAQGPTGPGGMVEFTTDAAPTDVVAFYRQKAEAHGLSTITSLNQGDTQGYSAGDGANGRGQLLSVVAQPAEGATRVQLDWSAGR